MKTRLLLTLAVAMLLVGCATVYNSVVTTTSVVDTAMKAWAEVSAKGYSTAAVDAKVILVHNKYRASCSVAQKALEAYKDSGDQAAYLQAWDVVKGTAVELIQLISPLIDPSKATNIQTQLSKANSI